METETQELKELITMSTVRDRNFDMQNSAYTDFFLNYLLHPEKIELLTRVLNEKNTSFKEQTEDIKNDIEAWNIRFLSDPNLKSKYKELGRRLYEYCECFGYAPDFSNRAMNSAIFNENCEPLLPRVEQVMPWFIEPEDIEKVRIEVEYVFILSKMMDDVSDLFNVKDKIKKQLVKAVENNKNIRTRYDDKFADKLILSNLDADSKKPSVYDIPYTKLMAYNSIAEKYCI